MIGRDRRVARVAVVSGVIFVFAGLVKFVFHHWELHAFQSFGLPWPSALEILAGVLETVGGVLLVLRRWVAPVAGLLALTMVVAIAASGVGHGDVIPSLTLAPALLIAMLYLLSSARPPNRPTAGARRKSGNGRATSENLTISVGHLYENVRNPTTPADDQRSSSPVGPCPRRQVGVNDVRATSVLHFRSLPAHREHAGRLVTAGGRERPAASGDRRPGTAASSSLRMSALRRARDHRRWVQGGRQLPQLREF